MPKLRSVLKIWLNLSGPLAFHRCQRGGKGVLCLDRVEFLLKVLLAESKALSVGFFFDGFG
jgi:hypothetical protein